MTTDCLATEGLENVFFFQSIQGRTLHVFKVEQAFTDGLRHQCSTLAERTHIIVTFLHDGHVITCNWKRA